jgi:hypothetical protein
MDGLLDGLGMDMLTFSQDCFNSLHDSFISSQTPSVSVVRFEACGHIGIGGPDAIRYLLGETLMPHIGQGGHGVRSKMVTQPQRRPHATP